MRELIGQRLSNVRKQQKTISIVPILFLYYEESLVSSNLNLKQLRFHGVRPRLATYLELVKALYLLELEFINFTNRCFNPVFVFWNTQVGNVACKFYTLRECSLHNFPPKYFIKTL